MKMSCVKMQYSLLFYFLILYQITYANSGFIKYNGYAINITKLDDNEESTNLTNINAFKHVKELVSVLRKMSNNKHTSENPQIEEEEPPTSGYLTSNNYPDPYDENSGVIFTKSFGDPYGIDLYIEEFDLDGESGDYLLIKSGKSMDDDGNGLIYTYKIKTPKYIKILNSDSVFIEFVVQKRTSGANIKNKGFQIKWERTGDIELTTEPPVTTERLPTDDEGRKPEIIEYLLETPYEFLSHSEKFQDMLVEMASLFCKNQSIMLEKDVTTQNVLINQISNCPIVWPDYLNCVAVNFSIPVFVDDSPPQTRNDEEIIEKTGSYELTSDNLDLMWNMYQEKLLKKYHFTAYKVPNDKKIIWIWQGVIIIVCLFFISFLYIMWKHLFCLKKCYTTNELTEDIIEATKRASNSSDLSRTEKHLIVPPLYDSTLYEPEWLVSTERNDDNFDDIDNDMNTSTTSKKLYSKNSEQKADSNQFVPKIQRGVTFADDDDEST